MTEPLTADHVATPVDQPVLRADAIRKSFSGTPVLEGVSFDLRPGEVHTLMGENGAGKSTLLKILAGVHRPDAGQLLLRGRPVAVPSPNAARALGIALIHQEPLTFPDLTVAENILLGHDAPRGRLGQLDWTRLNARASELLTSLGVPLDPRAKVRGLSVADQQMIELAAALSQDARVLLMDEPTAALTPQEVARLFDIVRRLRADGVAIVFISHRLPEVFEISDRITVLRDGQFIATKAVGETTPDDVIRMMVGRPLETLYDKPPASLGPELLRVERLSRRGRFHDVSFSLRAGEIVGMAGLVGAGRTDVARCIFGVDPADSGTLHVRGQAVRIRSPRHAIARGIAYVPEDRQHHGLLLPFSTAKNISLASPRQVSRFGFLRFARERDLARQWHDRLAVRAAGVTQPAAELSGGNQQKIVLSKWLLTAPDILILDEPTRGVDVGAKAEVHALIGQLAQQGKAILLISSDLPEVLAMSDRVLVMHEGHLTAELPRSEATQERVMTAATGQHAPAPAVSSRRQQQGSGRGGRGGIWAYARQGGIAAIVLLAAALAAIFEPRFLSLDTLRSILLYIPLIVVVAMGQMMVIITRNIDLSVGSILALAAIVVGGLFATVPDLPLPLAALLATAIGTALGLLNGTLVAYLRVPAIIATLGTLTAYRGLVFIYSGGRQVDNNDLPPELIRLSQTSPLAGIPAILLFAAAVAAAAALFLRYTATGRAIYAIGSNPAAAALRGMPVRRTLLLVFTLTGALAGIAGLMFASRFGYVNPVSTGAQLELIVISAAVIGGTNVFGGSGTVPGTLLGCLLLGVVNVALPMAGISTFWQLAIYGSTILLAASMDGLIHRYANRGATE